MMAVDIIQARTNMFGTVRGRIPGVRGHSIRLTDPDEAATADSFDEIEEIEEVEEFSEEEDAGSLAEFIEDDDSISPSGEEEVRPFSRDSDESSVDEWWDRFRNNMGTNRFTIDLTDDTPLIYHRGLPEPPRPSTPTQRTRSSRRLVQSTISFPEKRPEEKRRLNTIPVPDAIENEPAAEEGQKICGICYERAVKVAIIPCGDYRMCVTCSRESSMEKKPLCPFCRGRVKGLYKIYSDGNEAIKKKEEATKPPEITQDVSSEDGTVSFVGTKLTKKRKRAQSRA
jgi:hypothetical protein